VTSPTLAQMRPHYAKQWKAMTIRPERRLAIASVVAKIVASRSRYEAVSAQTDIPWWFVGCIHYREASPPCSFTGWLGNGDAIIGPAAVAKGRKSWHVPAGYGPFEDWEAGAVVALERQRLCNLSDWSVEACLYRWEFQFNGPGYYNHGCPSAYNFSWTSEYTRGKYREDSKWDPNFMDPQPGCAAMLRALIDAGHVFEASLCTAGAPSAAEPVPAIEADLVAVRIGSRGDEVRVLQGKLRDLGYSVGAVDGMFGEATADGVAAFQRRNGLSGEPGAWRKSYYEKLTSAPSVIPAIRADAKPADLESRGDIVTQACRWGRNAIMGTLGLFGITVGQGDTIVQTLSQTQDAADRMHGIVTWMHGHAWAGLIVVGVACAVVLEAVRHFRAKDYATGAYQGPAPKTEA
jgi:lysozyme family protein